MKTSVEKLNPTRVKLDIVVTSDDLKPAIEKAYKTVSEQVNIPGFRKGKVPAPIIDQRVGRGAVIEQAVNDSLDDFYRSALSETGVVPIGRPEADVTEWPDPTTGKGDLKLSIEVDARPDVELPAYDSLSVEVEPVKADKADVDEALDQLRSRFGTLQTVERPAKTGDFVQIDLTAQIGDQTVDEASDISYEIGSGDLLEGIDEALETLTAGESTTFESVLLGGEHEGETAQISVTVNAVKERELPEADDDFAQMASEFDTIKELREDLAKQAEKRAEMAQISEARDKVVEALVEKANVPVPDALIDEEVKNHLEQEGKSEDDEHAAEVRESAIKGFQQQVVLDLVAEKENVQVSQEEFTQYLIQMSQQYGIPPQEFVNLLQQNGQLPSIMADVARNKSVAFVLDKATVKDTKGKKVDVSEFTKPIVSPASQGEQAAEAAADEAEKPVKKAPAKKKAAAKADPTDASAPAAAADKDAKPAAKKPAAKKKADAAADDAEKPAAKKAPAKKPAAKKTDAKDEK